MDPTSSIGEVDPEDAPACAACGDPVVSVEHRVRTRLVGGVVEHYHFCDTACLADWVHEADAAAVESDD
jgi:hypothetical protein